MEALRISPQYKAEHWPKLDKSKEEDWPTAASIVHGRLHGRFLKFADMCLKEDSSGFVVLSIDCLLVETLQQFIEGETRDWSDSERSFKRFPRRTTVRNVIHSSADAPKIKQNLFPVSKGCAGTAAILDDVKGIVQEKYGAAARRVTEGEENACCAASARCDNNDPITGDLYSAEQASEIPEEAVRASLGCGKPEPCLWMIANR